MLKLDRKLKLKDIPDITITTKDSGRIDLWDYIEGDWKHLRFQRATKIPKGMSRDISTLGNIKFKRIPKGQYKLYLVIIDKGNAKYPFEINLTVIEEPK